MWNVEAVVSLIRSFNRSGTGNRSQAGADAYDERIQFKTGCLPGFDGGHVAVRGNTSVGIYSATP